MTSVPLVRRTPPALPVRPWMPPVLHSAWRGPGILQIGADPDNAIVLEGITPALYDLILNLDGYRTCSELVATAVRAGCLASDAERLLRILTSAGCVVDLHLPQTRGKSAASHPDQRPQLLPDIAGRVLAGAAFSPVGLIADRSAASVIIHGSRRVGTVIGSMLAASGVGGVSVIDNGAVHPADVVPGGMTSAEVGLHRRDAGERAIRRFAPRTRTATPDSLANPDVVVITDPWPEPDERERVLRLIGAPYLFAAVVERRGVVGPFVVPGVTSCLECQHLQRRDRDHSWSAVAAQMRFRSGGNAETGEAPLAMLTASLAAMQVLDWIDGQRPVATCDATLEFHSKSLRIERRAWSRHPRCPCSAGR